MRRIAAALLVGPGSLEFAGGATRQRKPYMLISCPHNAASAQSASRPNSLTTQDLRPPVPWRWCLRGTVLHKGAIQLPPAVKDKRRLGSHARAGADRYSLNHPHAVTLNIAAAAPGQRPRTQDARELSIAGPLCAIRLVRLFSCSAHLLHVASSPRPGGPCLRNVGTWFRRNSVGHHQHLRSLSLFTFQAPGPMWVGDTQSFCP